MKNRNNGSRIFMTELMFSILFFIIVSAICIQCFAGSFSTSRDATELTQAVNLATNAAEEYLSDDSFEGFTAYYNKDWELTGKSKYKVEATIAEPKQQGDCQTMNVTVTTVDNKELYSLEVKKALH
ncbi:MAG: hypothetical protein K5769_06225 [Pseudobutyrivibrio sp.]|nr:hypothetical protein [Pseudobutyrivibrio sp.]